MRITKVYTRTGDKGETSLAGGRRVPKDHPRIEAYGTVDELNAVVGVVRAHLKKAKGGGKPARRLDAELDRIQNRLLDVGAILATLPGDRFKNMPEIASEEILHLEELMDDCQKNLKPLEEFLLPGGGITASFLHLARTVCRRAERLCVRLAREESVPPQVIHYMNRLSDAFFVLARWTALFQKEPEHLWERARPPK